MSPKAGSERIEKLLCLLGLGLAIELVLFKFLPDISNGLIEGARSNLTDFPLFERDYIDVGSLSYTRFLGNRILWHVAQLIGHLVHSPDPRLHPLRIAAGVLTPIYAWIGAYPVLRGNREWNWRHFMAVYSVLVVISLYVFYPYDMPALAFISIAMYCLLRERLGLTLLFMLLTGLFRETSFHVVTWVGLWVLLSGSRPARERVGWFCVFALAFILEYKAIRHFYPGPVTGAGHLVFDPREIFLGPGMLSLTAICSLGLEAVIALLCLNRLLRHPSGDWRRRFFLINCCVLPAWWIFYRMMDGNLSEFRLLLPALLPFAYGLSLGCSGSTAARCEQ